MAPEVRAGGNPETGRLVLLRNNLLAAALIFLGLELWRPCFFLTDDNLDGGLPFFTEMGHHLLSGRSPFYSEWLFGGHYDLLRDPTFFCWHPQYFLLSLLAGTPLRLWIMDANAFVFLMIAAAGFVNLAWHLRRELALKVSDGWIMFYTLSFTYSMITLTTGASWLNFLGNESALPWLALGLFQRTWWRGAGLVAVFSLHQVLGGHLEPNISSTLFVSLFAVGLCFWRNSLLPLACWTAGYAAALIFISPLLFHMLGGFFSSARSHGVEAWDMQSNNIPFDLFPTSLFAGMALWIIHSGTHPNVTYTLALGSCAAAWLLLPALVGRNWTGLEKLLGALLALIAIMVCRPEWVSELMLHVPVIKSMRWPFRELIQFQFFFHLFLLVRTPGFAAGPRKFLAWWGAFLLVVPMGLYVPAPTFNSMERDRELLLSGGFGQYWSQVRPLFGPGDRLAVILPLEVYTDDRFGVPYSLISTYNYSCLTHVVNAAGYSQTVPDDQFYTRMHPAYPFGAYMPWQKAALMAERPELKFITLESLQPLKITLSSRDGPTIDLTRFVPKERLPRGGVVHNPPENR